jgi:hypothetical protein
MTAFEGRRANMEEAEMTCLARFEELSNDTNEMGGYRKSTVALG